MYYIDIGIISDQTDKSFYLTTMLCAIHDNSNRWNVAISFPNFKTGRTLTHKKMGYNSYAMTGSVLRLFHKEESILNEIIQSDLLQSFKKKHLIITTKLTLAPITEQFEYYLRDQTENHIRIAKTNIVKKNFTVEEYNGVTINKNADYWKKRLLKLQSKSKQEETNKFYLLTYSKSKNTNFSLFVTREISNVKSDNFTPTSYGLSNKENITYLPLFESSLDI